MTCDPSDAAGRPADEDLAWQLDHERDVYAAGYDCLLALLTGDRHAFDHMDDLRAIAHEIDADVHDQIDRPKRDGSMTCPRRIYGLGSASQALGRYARGYAAIRGLVTQVRVRELDPASLAPLILAELDQAARDLGGIADYSLRLARMREALNGDSTDI